MVMELTKMETWEVYVTVQWWWSSEIWDPAVLVVQESERWWQEKFALKDGSLSKTVSWNWMQWSVAIGICWRLWWLLHLNTGLVLFSSAMSGMQLWSKCLRSSHSSYNKACEGVSFLCFNIKLSANAIVIMLTKLKCSLSGSQALFGCLFLSRSLMEHLCVLLPLVHVLPLSFLDEESFF